MECFSLTWVFTHFTKYKYGGGRLRYTRKVGHHPNPESQVSPLKARTIASFLCVFLEIWIILLWILQLAFHLIFQRDLLTKKSIFQLQDPLNQNCPLGKLSNWGIDQSNQWLLDLFESVFTSWVIYYLSSSPAKFQFFHQACGSRWPRDSPQSSGNCLALEPISNSTA